VDAGQGGQQLPGAGCSRVRVPVITGSAVSSADCSVSAIAVVDSYLIDEQADFHQLGGNSLLLSMIDEVLSSVAPHGEAELRDELARIIREPTLAQVSVLAREIRDKKREETALAGSDAARDAG
jgi:hypothetical protein